MRIIKNHGPRADRLDGRTRCIPVSDGDGSSFGVKSQADARVHRQAKNADNRRRDDEPDEGDGLDDPMADDKRNARNHIKHQSPAEGTKK